MKAALCIVPVFPPVAETGVHRVRAIARHLPEHGWRAVVVTMKPGAPQDPGLMKGLPEGLPVYRTACPALLEGAVRLAKAVRRTLTRGAQTRPPEDPDRQPAPRTRPAGGWSDWLTWWLKLPDLALGWLPSGLMAARRAAARHRCRVIFSSAPPWTTHLIALLAKRMTGLPWVADFRDPWRAIPEGNPFRSIPYRSIDACDAWLERQVVQAADRVICNTEAVRQDFVRRFPGDGHKFVTVFNGFDPEDYAGLGSQRAVGPETLLLTYAGSFSGPRRPGPLFEAIGLLRKDPAFGRELCLQMLGPTRYGAEELADLAERFGVREQVWVRGNQAHRDAQECMRGSDILVLVGFNGPWAKLQVPAKLFEYLAVGRPILALAPAGSSIADVVARSGLRAELCDPDAPPSIARAIARLAGPDGSVPPAPADPGQLSQFHRRVQVGTIARLFSEVAAARP